MFFDVLELGSIWYRITYTRPTLFGSNHSFIMKSEQNQTYQYLCLAANSFVEHVEARFVVEHAARFPLILRVEEQLQGVLLQLLQSDFHEVDN